MLIICQLKASSGYSGDVNVLIKVEIASLNVIIIDEFFNTFFDKFSRWGKLSFEYLHKLCLKLGVGNAFSHLHYLHYSFL